MDHPLVPVQYTQQVHGPEKREQIQMLDLEFFNNYPVYTVVIIPLAKELHDVQLHSSMIDDDELLVEGGEHSLAG